MRYFCLILFVLPNTCKSIQNIGSENPDKKLQHYYRNCKRNDMNRLNLNLALVLVVIPDKPALRGRHADAFFCHK